jgi:hypothetical protein
MPVLVAVIVLVLTGCTHRTHTTPQTSTTPTQASSQPSSSTSAQSSVPTTKAGYVRSADDVCASGQQRLTALPLPTGPSELVASLRARLQVAQAVLADLERLTPPEQDRASLSALLLSPYRAAITRQQQLIPNVAAAVASGDHVMLANMENDYETAGHPSSAAAFVRSYGLQSCQGYDYFRSP